MSSRVLHGTGAPVAGYLGSLICREVRLDGENNPQELAPFRLAAVAPASLGPIPQPVSMSARILWGGSPIRKHLGLIFRGGARLMRHCINTLVH